MANFSKQTQTFFTALGEEATKVLTPTVNSPDRITPGDVIIFRYYRAATSRYIAGVNKSTSSSREQYVILIVKTRRGDGCFPGKNGKLVSCFKLEGKSDVIIQTIVENLYKKRRRSSYYGKIKQSLISILGKESFRTFKLDQMIELYKLQIKKNKPDGR